VQKIISFVQVNFQQGPQELNAYYLPYTAGVVLAYALEHNPDWMLGELVWRRDPLEETAQRLKHSDVVGFSTYVWNHQYNYKLAQRVKELNPQCLIITGGPEVAIADPELFVKNPWMDAAVKMEGELVFSQLLNSYGNSLLEIPGMIVNCNGQAVDTGNSNRIDNLNQLPSPYLTGLFDNLVDTYPDITWNATLETNRGCPYQCTFCDWGSLTYNKVKLFDLDRVFQELEWIGKHCGFVTITDANFGMFVERDNAIVSKLINVQLQWNNLSNFSITWAKNQKNEVVDIVRRLVNESPTASQGLTVSVQSMSEGVLDIIKRRNLDQHKIEEIFTLCDRYNIPVHTELILGLPGDTETSWKENFWRLFKAGNHTGISILHAQLLENAEMNINQRQFYKLDAVPIYDYMSGSYSNGEVEESMEVVIGTRDLPRDKMLDLMVWNSFIQTFHINGLSNYIARYMARQGVDYKEFYHKLWIRLQDDAWWQQQFATTRRLYQEWITTGRVNIQVNDISVPGWNLHNQTTLILNAENKIDQVYSLLHEFVCSEFEIECAEQLVKFQRGTVITHARLSQLPQRQQFDWDFLGYLVYDTQLNKSACYEYNTTEDKTMSPKMFLENFYFGRKRNFGKAHISYVAVTDRVSM
jgi:radical SAM superfamily enzyme YgiQ (UPF0313 family)